MSETNFYEELLSVVGEEFGNDMKQFVPPMGELESEIEYEFFGTEAVVSSWLLKRIVENINANHPSKVGKSKMKSIIERLGFEDMFSVEDMRRNVNEYFHSVFGCDAATEAKSPISLYILVAAFCHRFVLYSINPVEEKSMYLVARLRAALAVEERGDADIAFVEDPERVFAKYIKTKKFKNSSLCKAFSNRGKTLELAELYPIIKSVYGVYTLVCLQNGEMPLEIMEDMIAHLSAVIELQEELVKHFERQRGGLIDVEPIIIDVDNPEEAQLVKERFEAMARDYEREKESAVAGEAKEKSPKKKHRRRGKFKLLGRRDLNKFFNEKVIDVVDNEKVYKKFGIDFPSPFLLEGPPGCGKTFAVDRLAEYLDWNCYHITSTSVGSTLIHETAKKTEDIFAKAAKTSPSLVVVDEMDAFMPDRSRTGHSDSHVIEEVSSFLKCIQDASAKKILVVGMTNYIKNIDPAILRSGRMGTHITLEMPTEEEIREVMEAELKKRPCAKFDLGQYTSRLLDRPLSDVVEVVREASMSAARRRADNLCEEDMEYGFEALKSRDEERRTMGFVTNAKK